MAQACRAVELAVHVGNQGDGAAVVLSLLRNEGIPIRAYNICCEPDHYVVRVVPADPFRAKTVLEAAGYCCKANQVVLVGSTQRIGEVAAMGERLRESRVDILYSYGVPDGAGRTTAVFKTSDDERALRVLQMLAWVEVVA